MDKGGRRGPSHWPNPPSIPWTAGRNRCWSSPKSGSAIGWTVRVTPGRHSGLTILNAVPQLPLRRAESGLRVQGVHDHRPGRGHRRDPGLGHPRLRGLHALQGGLPQVRGRYGRLGRGVGSVNTIVNTDGQLRAYNTDYLADHQVPVNHTVAVLGSGGMAKAVVAALRDAGFHAGTVVARNALADQYGYAWRAEVGSSRPQLLVNATPGRDVEWARRRGPAGGARGGGQRRDRVRRGRPARADPACSPGTGPRASRSSSAL